MYKIILDYLRLQFCLPVLFSISVLNVQQAVWVDHLPAEQEHGADDER